MHDLTEFCSATMIEFGNKWSRLGADVQEQVEKAMVFGLLADVNRNAIFEAKKALEGINNEIDEGLQMWLDAEDADTLDHADYEEDGE